MENTVALLMPKGGTGKTTATVNLAGTLAQLGKRVLVVENDWQGSASVHVGLKEPDAENGGLAEVLGSRLSVELAIRNLPDGIDLLPGNGDLANVDVGLLGLGEAGIYRLRDGLAPVAIGYHVILIDSEPGMHVRNLGALAVADYLLLPVSADHLSVKPLKLFLRVLASARQRYHLPPHRVGVLVTCFDARQSQAQAVVEVLQELAPVAGLVLFEVIIPERAAHGRAAAAGESLARCDGHFARELASLYRNLAERVMAW